MGSKSTHQFPTLATLEPDDLFYVVREESPGVYKDYSAPRSLLPESVQVATVLLTSAEILDIFDTPVELVASQGSGSLIVLKMVTMNAVDGTTAYVGDFLIGGSTINSTNYIIQCPIPEQETPIPFNVIYPNNAGTSINQGVAPGSPLNISALTTNPTTGDGDVLVKVYYTVING